MASRNINIKMSVYERLSRLRKANESFSQVLDRLIGATSKKLSDSFGMGKDLSYEEIKKSRKSRDVVY
jgi:predicted CopG family antitoxin